MTYRLTIEEVKDILHCLKKCNSDLESFMNSLYESMRLTNQKFVYIKGQPEY